MQKENFQYSHFEEHHSDEIVALHEQMSDGASRVAVAYLPSAEEEVNALDDVPRFSGEISACESEKKTQILE